MPQATVARHLGLSQGAVSRRLTGEVSFRVAELELLAELLGLHPATFFASGLSANPPTPAFP